ncbi:MAG: hypothetical protein AAF268_07960 [Cyanobacteria bacterium P01_A01_bin.3]
MKFYILEAFSLLLKTMPFILIRLGTYALLGVGLTIYFAIAGGIAWLLGQLFGPLGFIIMLAAAAGAWGIVQWATRYFFYLLKAAHTAVLTELIVTGELPSGSQVEYGKQQVTDRFRDTSIMFAVDRLVDGIVRGFNRKFARIADLLPIPGMDSLVGVVQTIIGFATTFIDESILSRAYRYREENVWAVAQDGVILYAQAWKPVLANAAALALVSYLEVLVVLVVLGLPAIGLGLLVPALKTPLGIMVLLAAWMFKLAFADAHALAATLLAYHRSTEDLTPDAEWQERLSGLSDKFRELVKNAAEATGRVRGKLASTLDNDPSVTPPDDTPSTETLS